MSPRALSLTRGRGDTIMRPVMAASRKKKSKKKTSSQRGPRLDTKTGFKRYAGRPRPDAERVAALDALLIEHYGWARCALSHEGPFQLLIATILSAQCTDEVVNQVTPALFERFPDATSLAAASVGEVEKLVYRTGFYRNKAKNIIGAARKVSREFAGELPRDIERFVTIPGAARKTANVVLGTAFGLAQGVVVDTHVARITRRWGFHSLKDATRIERVLVELLPQARWIDFSHQVIWHGRKRCMARKPDCDHCPLLPHCPEGEQHII